MVNEPSASSGINDPAVASDADDEKEDEEMSVNALFELSGNGMKQKS